MWKHSHTQLLKPGTLLGKRICISLGGSWLNVEDSPSEGVSGRVSGARVGGQPPPSACSRPGISSDCFGNQNLPFTSQQLRLCRDPLISNSLVALKRRFMRTKEPLTFKSVSAFQFFSFCLCTFLKVQRNGDSSIPFTPPSGSGCYLFSPEFCSSVILRLDEGHSWGTPPCRQCPASAPAESAPGSRQG